MLVALSGGANRIFSQPRTFGLLSRSSDWRLSAPGLVGERFYDDLRSISAPAVGSVVGIGGMAGAVGGMLIAKVVGYVLQWTGTYLPIFIIAG